MALADPRSALWFEFLRIIEEAQPRMVLIENVAVLRSRGLDVVISGLAAAGYGCWWDVVSALAVGAPHLRERVWITCVHFEEMPDLEGKPFKAITAKLPRAGASTSRGMIEMEPQATQRMAKAAMGAIKREDGTTWLTKLDSPLFPTPSASSYGNNCGAAAGRVGPVRHSLESMARHRMWPTPHGFRKDEYDRPQGPSGNELGHAVNREPESNGRMWPTASARDFKDMGLHEGAIGRGQLPEAVRNSLRETEAQMFPTPRSSDAERGGRGDLIQVVRGNKGDSSHGDQRIWPTPRASANELRTTKSAPSHGTTHGEVLSGVVCDTERLEGRDVPQGTQNAGPLSPIFTEWLMGLPLFWTDLDCDEPIQVDWLREYVPRVLKDVPFRKERLMACGNSLVWAVAYTRIMQAHRLLGIS